MAGSGRMTSSETVHDRVTRLSRDLLGRELLADLLKYGLPWLEYRSDPERALDGPQFLKWFEGGRTTHENIYAHSKVALMAMLGRRA